MYDLGYHVMCCSKYRPAVLTGVVKDCCEALIRAKAARHGRHLVAPEIMPDHGYLFVKTHSQDPPSHLANQYGYHRTRPWNRI